MEYLSEYRCLKQSEMIDIQKFIHSKKMKGYYDKIGSSASGNLISMFLLNIK